MPLNPNEIRQFVRDLIEANPRNDRTARAILTSIPRGDELLDTSLISVLTAVTVGDLVDMVDASNDD